MRYLDVAIRAARKAGRIHKKYFESCPAARLKTASYDLVTVADTEAEKAIIGVIKNYFPQHNILAEEYTYPKTDSEYTWVIDPLDGTNNFASGMPIFCASVGLTHNGRVIAGAVYDVTRDELFYAQKNKGAFLNGKSIRVNNARTLKKSILITGFYYSKGREMVETLRAIERFQYEHIIGIRRLGAAALDLCYVSCGRAAGFWEFQLSPWDFTAGSLLVEEAGGRISGARAEKIPFDKKYFIVASNGKIHKRMLEIINRKAA